MEMDAGIAIDGMIFLCYIMLSGLRVNLNETLCFLTLLYQGRRLAVREAKGVILWTYVNNLLANTLLIYWWVWWCGTYVIGLPQIMATKKVVTSHFKSNNINI